MPLSIGVNLRVTGHCNQGGRKYMEDMFSVAYQQTPDDKDLEYAFFGIFDGHGGGEAATFAKEHLMDIIVKQKNFWSDRDEDVLRAIRDGYVNTHYAMWRELGNWTVNNKWPRTASGLPSTAGTTASIAFIRKGKIYIGHVGDSGIILGHQPDGDPQWRAKALTKDHKPESGPEMIRIQESGGKVVSKSGVPRVVWNRPRIGHKGPVRRSTRIDEIPFLAVARSLGDLWSYNSELDTFIVSPEPDVKVVAVDVTSYRCLIFGTDGLWNMLTPQAAVAIVQAAEMHNEKHIIASQQTGNGADVQMWINPSKSLVDRALERWSSTRLRADNTSVVTVMLDPPGPSRSEVLLSQKNERVLSSKNIVHHRGIRPLDPSILSENIEKPMSSIATSSVLQNMPTPNLDIIDPKQPDSSNEILENLETSTKSEDTLYVEKTILNIDTCDINNILPTKEIDANSNVEGIQVAEISSSEISDDIGYIESKDSKADKTEELSNKLDDENTPEETAKTENFDTDSTILLEQAFQSHQPELKDGNDDSKVPNIIQQNNAIDEPYEVTPFVSKFGRAGTIISRRNTFKDIELKKNVLNGPRHKQHALISNAREDIRTTKRRHSLSMQSQNTLPDTLPLDPKPYVTVNSRLKSKSARTLEGTKETGKSSVCNRSNGGSTVSTKRRHSTMSSQSVTIGIEESCTVQEPCLKRRTRSEDRPSPIDENDPANQTLEDPKSRLSWPNNDSSIGRSTGGGSTTTPIQERLSSPNTFQRRSLGKKATPAKSIRRSSINGSARLQQLRGSFGLRDWDQGRNNRSSGCNDRRLNRTSGIIGPLDSTIPQRWLRSDTMAATPVKTLRSRNVDIAGHTISAQLVHHYGVVKPNRLSLPAKLKQSNGNGVLQSARVRSSSMSSNKFKQTGTSGSTSVGACSTVNNSSTGSSSGSGIAKRVKSPYNPSARSLATRSLMKLLAN